MNVTVLNSRPAEHEETFCCIICHFTHVEYSDEICEHCMVTEIDYEPEAA